MIRGFILLFLSLLVLAACASGKAVKSTTLYAPAELQISDINVDVSSDVEAGKKIRNLMRNAATNMALAYNENMAVSAPEYVMEISLEAYSASSALRYRVILRNPDDGVEYRSVPVAYGIGDAISYESHLRVKSLIKGSLPEAFQRLYGYLSAPGNVNTMLAREDVFADPNAQEVSAPVSYVASEVYSSPTTTTEPAVAGEPTVVTCAVC